MDKRILADKIKQLRLFNDFSQQEVADFLGINRASYSLIESGDRNVKLEELKILSEKFDMPTSVLLSDDPISEPKTKISEKAKKKFKELVLYILHKCGMKPNVGKTVLYKLLYFSDFNFYEKYWEKLSWIPYIKLPMWPAPYNFDLIIKEMRDDNEIIEVHTEFNGFYQHRYIPNKNCECPFTPEEKKIIDQVIDDLSDSLASQISAYSHEDAPWKNTKDMKIIDYDLVKQREYPYSILAREWKKAEAFAEIRASGMFSDLADESDLYEKYR